MLWPSMARWDAAEMDGALAAVRSPLLVIQSTTRDAQLRRSPLKAGETSPWLAHLEKKISGLKIEIVTGVGHFPQLEAADTVNRLIAGFVQKP
jgi:pimeloyl-ACP methyl ester carboxylesterase